MGDWAVSCFAVAGTSRPPYPFRPLPAPYAGNPCRAAAVRVPGDRRDAGPTDIARAGQFVYVRGMTSLKSARFLLLSLMVCAWWSGCTPSGDSAADEEKDPNYLAGRSRRAALNFSGAVEAFEKALEGNPRSAAAHLELGLIYSQNITTNWARAIYHFEKYLELRPKASNADLIRQNVDYCKLALAREVPYTPNNDLVRKEVERLTRDNAELRQQVEQWKAQAALRAAAGTNGATAALSPAASGSRTASAPASAPTPGAADLAQGPDRGTAAPPGESAGRSLLSAAASAAASSSSSSSRTHVIKSGDTPYSIARNYGVKLATLLGANPGVDPKRLRPGQTLVIPFP